MFQELLFPLFFAACLAIEVDFTVEINPAKKECYYETIGKGASVDVEYQVNNTSAPEIILPPYVYMYHVTDLCAYLH